MPAAGWFDGVADVDDAFPLDPTESSDNDGDGVGDNADTDDDNDGVDDAVDLCADSQADPAPQRLKRNRNWTDSADLTSTFGCSASQIIDDAGLGAGHAMFGISNSALADWIASVS